MARIFPQALSNRVRNDPKKRAEVKLYDAFQQQLPKSWCVFYNVQWLGHTTAAYPRDGETDFILTHPDYGVLLIEVKGGHISYQGSRRQWISTDQSGNDHDINPFEQVIQCKYALINKFKSLPRWSQSWLPIVHAVAFPDSYLFSTVLPPEAPSEIILDAKSLTNIEKSILRIFAYWQGQNPHSLKPELQFLADLEKVLAPTITLRNPLSLQVADEHQEFIRLTDEQCQLLTKLNRIRRAKVSGCAGSGKTMMAVEKARRLAFEGFKTLLTCYNKPLADHLVEVTGNIDNLTVCTFHKLCHSMAAAAAIQLPDSSRISQSTLFEQRYPDALCDAISMRPDLRFDAIIVDEGQDFMDSWWTALEMCLVDEQKGVFYVFYDDNQRIYHNRSSVPDDLHLNPICLSENVRNTRTIHQALVSYYTSDHTPQPRGPIGRSIEVHHCANEKDLYKNLSQVLFKLTKTEGVPCKDIVVLTPRSLKATSPNHSLLEEFKLKDDLRLTQNVSDPSREILCTTIHSFKGLERPIVIVTEIDELFVENPLVDKDALCYVAFSRPRSHLILMGKQQIIIDLAPFTIR